VKPSLKRSSCTLLLFFGYELIFTNNKYVLALITETILILYDHFGVDARACSIHVYGRIYTYIYIHIPLPGIKMSPIDAISKQLLDRNAPK